MKKLMRLLVVLALLVGGGGMWFKQSIYFVMITLKDALAQGDVATVEQYADLDGFARAAVDFAQEMGTLAARDAGGSLGAGLFKGLTEIFKKPVSDQMVPELKDEIRASIADGTAVEVLGPFIPDEGFSAIGSVARSPGKRRVVLSGTCNGETALVEVDFLRVPKGPFDLFGTWKAVGIDRPAIGRLAEACHRGAQRSPTRRPKTQRKGDVIRTQP